jgi:hypothetical protein
MCSSLSELGSRSFYERTGKESVVKDIVRPHPMKIVEVPGMKTKKEIIILDETSEELGNPIPQTSDGKETTYNGADEAQQQIDYGKQITSSKYPVRRSVVKGNAVQHPTKIGEVPGKRTKDVLLFSDEISEEIEDQIPQTDGEETTYNEADEAQQQIDYSK